MKTYAAAVVFGAMMYFNGHYDAWKGCPWWAVVASVLMLFSGAGLVWAAQERR